MKNLLPTTVLIFVCACFSFSQDNKPTATPPTDDTDVVKISTNLIQLDVTVTDSKGKIVTDLRPEEIQIYENGKLQKTSNFSFVSNTRPVAANTLESDKKSDKKNVTGVPPLVAPKPQDVRRAIAIIVDDLTLSFSSAHWVKVALKKFVNEQMQEGDLVAILRSGSGIGALQQFTTDKRQLLAAVSKIHFNMSGSAKISVFNPIEPSLKEELNGTRDQKGGTRNFDRDIESDKESELEASQFRETIFASGTLGAVNYVIRGMKDLPGRKTVLLLSDGFSVVSRDSRGVPRSNRVLDLLRNLTDLANRASVVVHTIDPRGLQFDGFTAEDNVIGASNSIDPLGYNPAEQSLVQRRNELNDSQDGLRYLAEETGGLAITNDFNINRGIRRVLDDQSYYLVGYEPDDDTFDPKTRRYNKLVIKVTRPGTKVRYRSGFFGISEEQIAKQPSPLQGIYSALTSPFALNDISLRLNALFTSDEKQAGYLRSFLHIDTKNLTFAREPDGKYKTTFELLAATFGDNGVPVDGERTSYTMSLTDEGYQKVLRTGMVYQFGFRIKKAGAYQMRVAIRDTVTNKVGSANQFVEIPNLKKNRLALSGVALENAEFEAWKKRPANGAPDSNDTSDPIRDTAARQFKTGTVLSYAANVYNAKSNAAGLSSITTQAKLFDEQAVVFESKPTQSERPATSEMLVSGAMLLATRLKPGNYTLQVIVTDNNAKGNRKTTAQFLSFEIIK